MTAGIITVAAAEALLTAWNASWLRFTRPLRHAALPSAPLQEDMARSRTRRSSRGGHAQRAVVVLLGVHSSERPVAARTAVLRRRDHLDSHGSTDPDVWLIARTILPGRQTTDGPYAGSAAGPDQTGSWTIVSRTGAYRG
jgi:hypothetical protein